MITDETIQLGKFLSRSPDSGSGACASFVGVVRDRHEGKMVERLFYDCYRPMAEKQIASVIEAVKAKWPVHEVKVVHRAGWLEVGEAAVAVWVSAPHREEAFSACREAVDRIKREVPIWKKEVYVDGTCAWVGCEPAEARRP